MNHTKNQWLGVALWAMIVALPVSGFAQQLYWSQFGSQIGGVSQVGYVNLDGSGLVAAVQQHRVFGMEIVSATRQVYWIDGDAGTIVRANADFSGATTIVTGLGQPNHLNLAIDPVANLIFWSNADARTIGRASLDGGPILGIFSSTSYLPDDLAVDPANRWLYWASQSGEVVRSRYDGSDQVILLSDAGGGGSGLALDLTAGTMYLSIPNGYRIARANLDGTGLQTVLPTPGERPFGMELFNGRMYWTDLDGGRLRSARLDGSDARTILSGLTYPRQVYVLGGSEDSDNDGVANDQDVCPGTPAGDLVDANGCSIAQLVPCAGPFSGGRWRNHGQYVSTVVNVTELFVTAGFITEAEAEAIVRAAARSDCGKK